MSKNNKSPFLTVVASILATIIGACIGFFGVNAYFSPKGSDKYPSSKTVIFDKDEAIVNTLEIHFMMLGNKNTGDSVYIKAGEVDILIDAGSKTNSLDTIKNYVNENVTDGKLEYVVVTHAHEDHYAGFTVADTGIFDSYEIGTIIDFSKSAKDGEAGQPKGQYKKYLDERDGAIENGAEHKTAASLFNDGVGNGNVFTLAEDITMEVLYNYYYDNQSSDENEHSVCVMLNHGDRKFLLTGDLEEDGESRLVDNNDMGEVMLYKAGHHGSKTSSSAKLLSEIQPKICVVTCCCGNDEYTDTKANQFPTQAFINRISVYTERVFVTTMGALGYLPDNLKEQEYGPMNGNIVVNSVPNRVEVICSENDTLLKDTLWMQNEREMPEAWAS